MRKETEHTIALYADGLPPGQSRRATCECGGIDTLVISRLDNGRVAFKCHRASCDVRGFVGGSLTYVAPERARQPEKYYAGACAPLSPARKFYFEQRFGISMTLERQWVYENEDGDFVMPILNPYGGRRGYGIRRGAWKNIDGLPTCPLPNIVPKFMSFKHDPGPLLSWYPPSVQGTMWPVTGTVVLVEDQVSAMKCATRGCHGVALMGTDLDIEKVREIQRYGHPNDTIIALDEDAGAKAFKLARTWGAGLKNCRVVLLDVDLKDSESLLKTLGLA